MKLKHLKNLLLALMISGIVLGMNSVTNDAKAYILGYDLVDSGNHMDVDGNSKYMSYIWDGKAVWNAYKKGVIRKDSLFVIQDVYVRDIARSSNVLGTTNMVMNKIEMNPTTLKKSTATQIRHTAIHELGHALGLNHSTSKDVMYAYVNTINKLSVNDKESYNAAYRYY